MLKKLRELIFSYETSEKWVELDILYQLSEILIGDHYIAYNIKTRYGVDGEYFIKKVREDLQSIGISEPVEFNEAIKHYFLSLCGGRFEKEVEEKVKGITDAKLKEVIGITSRCSLLEPKGVPMCCSWATALLEDEVRNKLIQLGLVNLYYFSSRAFSHLDFMVPPYAKPILQTIEYDPERFGIPRPDISKLGEIIKMPKIRELVYWIVKDQMGLSVFISEDEFQKQRESFEDFQKILGELIHFGGLTFTYLPARKATSGRPARPASYHFNLAPELLENL